MKHTWKTLILSGIAIVMMEAELLAQRGRSSRSSGGSRSSAPRSSPRPSRSATPRSTPTRSRSYSAPSRSSRPTPSPSRSRSSRSSRSYRPSPAPSRRSSPTPSRSRSARSSRSYRPTPSAPSSSRSRSSRPSPSRSSYTPRSRSSSRPGLSSGSSRSNTNRYRSTPRYRSSPTRSNPSTPLSTGSSRGSSVRVRYRSSGSTPATRRPSRNDNSLRKLYDRIPSDRGATRASSRYVPSKGRDNRAARKPKATSSRINRSLSDRYSSRPTRGDKSRGGLNRRSPEPKGRAASIRSGGRRARDNRSSTNGARLGGARRSTSGVPNARLAKTRTARLSRATLQPRRSASGYARSRYHYGSRHYHYRHRHRLYAHLGLGFCWHLGWHWSDYYLCHPFYRHYYVGYGWNHYHWSCHYYHPLNYSTWWYPSSYSYSTPTYVYVNDHGDYSPYPSTVVINYSGIDEEKPKEAESKDTLIARHVTLGDFYFKEGRYKEASESYLRALTYAPEDASIHFLLADSLFAMGDYHYAAFIIGKAIGFDPTIASAEADKREFYKDKVDFEKQMATLQGYVKDKPFDPAGHLVLGYNLKFSERPEMAKKAFARVLEINPANAAAKAFLAALEGEKKPAAEAPKAAAEKGADK